jgi:hypothetical protein
MIPMPPNPLPLEECWKPQALGYILLWNHVVSILWLSDDKFGNLFRELALVVPLTICKRWSEEAGKVNVPAAPYP